MKLTKMEDGSKLTIKVEGRLDTTTAPELEKECQQLPGITELVLDFESLDYISSAGLRVLLSAQKKMNTQGKMIITHANEMVKEVFEVTGFLDILTVE